MRAFTIIHLLLALSAGALASLTTQASPAALLKRDYIMGNLSTYAAEDCTGDPINPTFQDPHADLKHGKCLPFGANPGANIGIHWGSVPGTTAVQFWFPTAQEGDKCTGKPMDNIVYRDPVGQEFDCIFFKSVAGPAGYVTFITWPLFQKGA